MARDAYRPLAPFAERVYSELVRDPTAKAGGLYLHSTATPHSVAAVRLWLHRATHQGTLTRHPCWPSPAGPATSAARYYARRSNLHAASCRMPDRRIAAPSRGDSAASYGRNGGMPDSYSRHPPS